MKKNGNIVKFLYKCKRPRRLENDVFVIYTPEKITIDPGETKKFNMQLKIFLPKHVTASCRLLFSYSNQKLKLLNSSIISQEYNQNIEIEDVYKTGEYLPPWNLNFELLNGNLTEKITTKKRQEIGYFCFLDTGRGDEMTYKYEKEK